MTAWLWSTYGIYWLLTLIPMELPSRDASTADVFRDLATLSMVGTGGLLAGFESMIERKKDEGATEMTLTHYASILVAGYLSLLHPIVPVLASTVIAIVVSLLLYYRGAFGSDILTNGFLVCTPIVLSAIMLLVDWPLYRITWITSLVLWPSDLTLMPAEIDGCRAALMATLVQGIAAYGSQNI